MFTVTMSLRFQTAIVVCDSSLIPFGADEV